MKEITAKKVKPSGLELVDRLVGVQRVTKVTKGGRAFGFTAIVVVGDEHGIGGQDLDFPLAQLGANTTDVLITKIHG